MKTVYPLQTKFAGGIKKSFGNTNTVSNSLDPDQDCPDLGPNCLPRLSADNKSCHKQGKSF